MSHCITIVSLGPGDSELITLKGLNSLREADYIFCPATVRSDGTMLSRAQEILAELGISSSGICLFPVAMNENRRYATDDYADVARMIAEKYRAGYKIVLTAEGDAGFYSSSAYVSDILKAQGISVERIAGVPAFIACAASENIRISEQDEETTVITYLASAEELITRIGEGRTLVLMKASRFESLVKEALKVTPDNVIFHYFENTGIASKQFYTCRRGEILTRRFPYFSLLLIRTED